MGATLIHKHLAESSKVELQRLAEQSSNEEVKELLRCIAQVGVNEVLTIREAKDLSPNEAAKCLGVSRTYINRLLNESVIPFYKVGSHKRIPSAAFWHFVEQREQAHRSFVQNIANLEIIHAQAVDELVELI